MIAADCHSPGAKSFEKNEASAPPRTGLPKWANPALLMLATLLVWGHTLSYQFVWDDTQFIVELKSIRSLKNVPEMFYRLDAQSSLPQGFVLFRPLRTLHYALLYWAAGQPEPQPRIYHLANVLWHGVAAILFYLVLCLLFERDRLKAELHTVASSCTVPPQALGFLLALGFAVQPVVSEVVCWAKSLDDIMATVFTLAATRSLLKWDGRNNHYRWALLYFLLAVYTKESAVPFALAAFLIFLGLKNFSFQDAFKRTMGFLAIALIFVVHRHFVIGRTSQTSPISGTHTQTLVDMLPVVPKYLRLLCGVPPFCIDYTYLPGHNPVFSAPVILGALMLLAFAGLAAWTWRRNDLRLISFGILWVALFLLPVSNLIPMMQYMAERFLYLPLIGWLLALGALLCRLPHSRLAIAIPAVLALIWAPVAWQRSCIWKDPLTLFVRTCQENPHARRAEENAVYAVFDLPQIRELFQLDQSHHQLEVRAGISAEKAERALATLNESRRLFPTDENILIATGIAQAVSGRPTEAIPLFESVTRISPTNVQAWSNLGLACLDAGQMDKAREALERALVLEPTRILALRSAARLYWQIQEFPNALKILEKLHELEPQNPEHERWILEAKQKIAAN